MAIVSFFIIINQNVEIENLVFQFPRAQAGAIIKHPKGAFAVECRNLSGKAVLDRPLFAGQFFFDKGVERCRFFAHG